MHSWSMKQHELNTFIIHHEKDPIRTTLDFPLATKHNNIMKGKEASSYFFYIIRFGAVLITTLCQHENDETVKKENKYWWYNGWVWAREPVEKSFEAELEKKDSRRVWFKYLQWKFPTLIIKAEQLRSSLSMCFWKPMLTPFHHTCSLLEMCPGASAGNPTRDRLQYKWKAACEYQSFKQSIQCLKILKCLNAFLH